MHDLGAVAWAYKAQLKRLSQLPVNKRRYLVVHASSGYGNKVHGLITGLLLGLVYYATDEVSSRDVAKKELSHLGRVVWSPEVKGFTHTDKGGVSKALPGLIDWSMISSSDAIVGTAGSTFGSTASTLRGIPYKSCHQ